MSKGLGTYRINGEKTRVRIDQDLEELRFIRTKILLTSHEDRIFSIVVWKSRFLLTASVDDYIHMYDLHTSRKICQFATFNDPVCSMELIQGSKRQYLCFSALCHRIVLLDPKSQKILQNFIHCSDVLLLLDLRNRRDVLFSDMCHRVFHWDFRRNMSTEWLIVEEGFIVSGMKHIDEEERLIAVAMHSSQRGYIMVIQLKFEGSKLSDFTLVREFEPPMAIYSFNYCKSLETLYLGSADTVTQIKLADGSMREHRLDCSADSSINEIVLFEGLEGSCWGVMASTLEAKLSIVDFKKGSQYEVPDMLLNLKIYNLRSKIELFQRGGRLFMAIVSHEFGFVLIYEVLIKL